MQTYSGNKFWPLDPRPDEIHLVDIAKALANICRFGGHSERFYSVAQHSVAVSALVLFTNKNRKSALIGLLHDAAEAYIGDMVRPLKHSPAMYEFRRAEERISRAIAQRFDLPYDQLGMLMPSEVKFADDTLLATECRDVMGGQRAGQWAELPPPLSDTIVAQPPDYACQLFVDTFLQLTS